MNQSITSTNRDQMITRLRAEHAALKAQLSHLDQQRFLTPTEQIERKRIQKLKLRTKDQLHRLSTPRF